MPWLSRLFIFFAITLLAGCSSMQLAYTNAPLLVQYQLDRYLDLSDEQEQLLKTELVQLRSWHQSQILPEYVKTLRQWAHALSQPQQITADEVLEKQQLLQTAALVFAQQAAQALGPVLLTLTERQKDRLITRFGAANEDYRKEYLNDPQRAMESRRERFIDNYERWLGALTTEQLALLSQWLNNHPNDPYRWAQERLFRQISLIEIIDRAPQYESRDQAATALSLYFKNLMENLTPQLKAQQASRQLALASLTAQMLNLMPPKQRSHLQSKLNSYADDFEKLTANAQPSS